MPDERTNSRITWFNSALRGNQNAQTLVDMIQIGQWYDKHEASFSFRQDFSLYANCVCIRTQTPRQRPLTQNRSAGLQ